jgi:hypothetical protein
MAQHIQGLPSNARQGRRGMLQQKQTKMRMSDECAIEFARKRLVERERERLVERERERVGGESETKVRKEETMAASKKYENDEQRMRCVVVFCVD